jgi:hypothetical protein
MTSRPFGSSCRAVVSMLVLMLALAGAGAAVAQEALPADAAPAPVALLPEPHAITRAIDFAIRTMGDGSREKSGIYPEMGNMITGAGWIAIGPGYRHGSAAFGWSPMRRPHVAVVLRAAADQATWWSG